MALFIIVLLNINSYAAVGANDGSAFVTKAEFDALINTFNEQMDTYQSGLNAKIDGAIANYLAGLSSQVLVDVSPMYIPQYGVWSASIVSDMRNWVEGKIGIDLSLYYDRYKQYDATNKWGEYNSFVVNLVNNYTTSLTTEHLISSNTYTYSGKSYALYKGYQKSDYTYTTYGNSMGVGSPSPYKNYVTFMNFKWKEASYGFEGNSSYDSPSSPTSRNNIYASQGLIQRTHDSYVFEDLIVTPETDVTTKTFTSERITPGFMNKRFNDGLDVHTKNVALSSVLKSSSVKANYLGTDYNPSFGASGNIQNTTFAYPFYGFVSNILSYNQLLTDKFASYKTLLSTKGKSTFIGNDKIRVTDGFPMFEVKQGDKVYIPLEFDKIDNEYKNIDIWVKISAFGADENVKTSTSADIIKPTNVENMIPSAYSNAITLDAINGSGKGQMMVEVPRDGVIYLKWSVAGNEGKGGGLFRPKDCKINREG